MKQLYTRWGRTFDTSNVLPEYPRPMMVRDSYINLNGYWEYAILENPEKPTGYDGQILVPFSPEAALSEVNRQLQPMQYLWYRRTFEKPEDMKDGCLLLHFGAVDQACHVWVNGTLVSRHVGGYLPFEADITKSLKEGTNELLIQVRDYSDTSYHAKGKQKLKAGGMFYTAQSGIWQTVWMEVVPQQYVRRMTATPLPDEKKIRIKVEAGEELPVEITVYPAGTFQEKSFMDYDRKNFPVGHESTDAASPLLTIKGRTNQEIEIELQQVSFWSPEEPYLYPYVMTAGEPDKADVIRSYFAMRSFTVEIDEKQIPRICLNHKPYFQNGVLDQGYWPEGLYTPPCDEALLFDIRSMKEIGFNMIRKHAKIELERWYYHCDRLGMIVWQDMVNGGTRYKHWYVTYMATLLSRNKIRAKDIFTRLLSRTSKAGRLEFIREMKETISVLYSHPCIATWVLFNEGWGQFQTQDMTLIARALDNTRLLDQASGWFDQGGGDLQSLHNYFFKLDFKPEGERATVLSEFGGYTMKVMGHICKEKTYGYGAFPNEEKLNKEFQIRIQEVFDKVDEGLCASVYTQLSDVEEEVNGLFTYDREVQKIKKIEHP
ncbi:MAG: glycoside hydrolase family 2 TIM barrel-domain containing protein [Hespellia sp.]|nr:glycoside hydrolase family 2 TIM barrel-domain containing protein [Hespellia sp.]